MKLTLYAVSDKGCVRTGNEDALLVGNEIIRDCSRSCTIHLKATSSPCLFAVADGMGGANAGEVASMMVLEQLRDTILKLPSALSETLLLDYMASVCRQIHTMVFEVGNGDAAKQGMGTTLTGLLWYEGQLYQLHAGDSRLYRYRSGILAQLSQDHSLRQTSGNNAIASNIIVNSFGGGESFYIDLKIAGGRQFTGDLYLLCSDGLSDMLDDEQIEQTLEAPGFENALLFKAKERGGYDNISYLIIQVVADEDNLVQPTSDRPVKLV